jgi:hypothetical protein
MVVGLNGQPLIRMDVMVEPRACHIAPIRGAWPENGAWQAATFSIKCKPKR